MTFLDAYGNERDVPSHMTIRSPSIELDPLDRRADQTLAACLLDEEHFPVLWQRPLCIRNLRFQCVCVYTNLIH